MKIQSEFSFAGILLVQNSLAITASVGISVSFSKTSRRL
jgi:hypothetical protein